MAGGYPITLDGEVRAQILDAVGGSMFALIDLGIESKGLPNIGGEHG